MAISNEREKIIQEVDRIPENRLLEVYSFLHYFRLGLETTQERVKPFMQYAGAWRDMPDDVFSGFLDSIATRRHEAFGGRRIRETNSD